MKKILLTFSLLGIVFFSASAQSKGISIGARGGLTIPKITAGGNNPMSEGYSSTQAGGAALFAEFHFSKLFSLRPMIEYSREGGDRNGMQAIPNRMIAPYLVDVPDPIKEQLPEYFYADFKSKTKFDYLKIPVLAKFGWDLSETSPFRIYVSAGPFVSFLMGAKQVTNGSSQLYVDQNGQKVAIDDILAQNGIPIQIGSRSFDREDEIKSQMNTVNCGLEGNIGIAYNFGRHSVFIEGGGSYGFLKLQKDTENGENRIGVGTVMVGYAYKLK